MAVLTFPWGTVTDTPNGATVSLHGFRFEADDRCASAAAAYLDGTMWPKWQGCMLCIQAMTCLLHMEWDPLVNPPTAKSVVKIGEGCWSGVRVPSMTPVLLNRDEATELAEVLRAVTKGYTNNSMKVAKTS